MAAQDGEGAGHRQKKKAMPLHEMLRRGLLPDGEVLRYKVCLLLSVPGLVRLFAVRFWTAILVITPFTSLSVQRQGKVHAVAVVDVAQQGLRLPNGHTVKGFSKFEDYAGSQAHRPCEFSLTLAGQRVQVQILHQDLQQSSHIQCTP